MHIPPSNGVLQTKSDRDTSRFTRRRRREDPTLMFNPIDAGRGRNKHKLDISRVITLQMGDDLCKLLLMERTGWLDIPDTLHHLLHLLLGHNPLRGEEALHRRSAAQRAAARLDVLLLRGFHGFWDLV